MAPIIKVARVTPTQRLVFSLPRWRPAVAALAFLCLMRPLPAALTRPPEPQAAAANPTQQKSAAARLEAGKPVENSLAGGESHSYGMQAEAGQFLHVVVEQLGIHVVLTLSGPDRKLIVSTENPNGTTGLQKISTIARSNGIYILDLASGDENAPPGHYRVSMDQLRVPTEADRSRTLAERIFDDAGELYAGGNMVSRNRAAQKYEVTLPLWRSAGDAYEEAVTLNRLGMIYDGLGARKKALDYFNQALPLMRAMGDHAGEAATLNHIGGIYDANGERGKALEQFKAALDFERDMGEQTLQPNTLGGLGKVYFELGDGDMALGAFEQALRQAHQLGDPYAQASLLGNIGMVYDCLGEKQKAIDYYNQALSLARTLDDGNGEAETLSKIGGVFDDLGERRKALDYYKQALKLALQLRNLAEEASIYNNIGLVYDELKQRQRALTSYNLALSLWRQVGNRTGEAKTLNNIGFFYHNLGQNQKALWYYKRARPILHAVGDRSAEAMTLHNIGVAYDRLGHTQEASHYQNQGLLLFLEVHDLLDEGLALSDLMLHSKNTGNPTLAIFFGKEAVNAYQQVRRNIVGLDKDLQKSFVSSKGDTYRELAGLLISQGRLPAAEQVLHLLKQEEYFEFIRRDGEEASSFTTPIALTTDESELNRKYEESANRITAIGDEWALLRAKRSRTPEEEEHLADLSNQMKVSNQVWSKFLSDLYVEFGQSKEAERRVENLQEYASGMQRVVRELGDGTLALYTLVGEERYRVIVVTPTVMVAREYLIKAEDLRKKVFQFRQVLVDPKSDPIPKAQELYRILVGPAAQDLAVAEAKTLMWSLDDVLRYVPMAALHDGDGYLVEKYRNEVFTPASVASLTELPNVNGLRGLGMGVSKSYGDFSALPSVPEELHRIIRDKNVSDTNGVLPGQTMLDETFTGDTMKKALEQNYPLVHIASHFVFSPGNETNSFLLLGGKSPQGEHLSLAEIRTDPAFSFTNTELLTLSACNTAVSGSAGDGREVDGLGILAQQKGAKSVVATLWAVNDESTGILMQNFYRLWITNAGMPKAEALRQGQLDFLHGNVAAKPTSGPRGFVPDKSDEQVMPDPLAPYTRPYYWAPFILIGNWN